MTQCTPEREGSLNTWNFLRAPPRSRSYGRTAALRLIVQPCDEDERWSVFSFHFSKQWSTGGMKLKRGNQSTRGKTCPSAIFPPQAPHGLTRDRTRVSAVERPATNRLSHDTAGHCLVSHWRKQNRLRNRFRLPLRYWWDLRSSGILRRVEW